MTLVDAATALIDDKKQAAAKKESLAILAPNNAETSVTKHHDGDSSTTPPPPHMNSQSRVALVSPSTPKTNNRTPPVAVGFREPKQSFARVLMDVLMDEKLNDIITFLPDGDAFAILEPKQFAEIVMPKYFSIK